MVLASTNHRAQRPFEDSFCVKQGLIVKIRMEQGLQLKTTSAPFRVAASASHVLDQALSLNLKSDL